MEDNLKISISSLRLSQGTEALNLDQTRFVTSAELAAYLSVSIHTVRKWRSLQKIIPRKFGRSVRWDITEVVATLAKKEKQGR